MPCFLTLEGNDTQVLDLLSAPSSIVLSLRRRVRFYNKTSSSRSDVAWNEMVEDMGVAVWWPSSDVPSDAHARHLEGEIRLAKDLRPTSEMGHFSISVRFSTRLGALSLFPNTDRTFYFLFKCLVLRRALPVHRRRLRLRLDRAPL
jgi:hypothetical protein